MSRRLVVIAVAALLLAVSTLAHGQTAGGSTTQQPASPPSRPALTLTMGHSGAVNCLAFSPDGRTLASGSADNTVRLWDAKTRELRAVLEGHTGKVETLTYSEDGRVLVSTGGDGMVRVWDAATGRALLAVKSRVYAMARDGESLAIGSSETIARGYLGVSTKPLKADEARRLQVAAGAMITEVYPGTPAHEVGLLNSDVIVRVGDKQVGDVELFDEIARHRPGDRLALRVLRAGNPLDLTATLGTKDFEQGRVAIWDTQTGKQTQAIPITDLWGWACSIALSPDGKTVAAAIMNDGEVRLWDVQTGQLEAALAWPHSMVSNGDTLTFSGDGRLLFLFSMGTTGVWDVAQRKLASVVEQKQCFWAGRGEEGDRVVVSPDSQTAVIAEKEGALRLWDAASARMREALKRPGEQMVAVAFSTDGGVIAAGYPHSGVWLWDTTSMSLLARLQVPFDWDWRVAVSPDRRTLVTGGDKTIHFWDLSTGKPQGATAPYGGKVSTFEVSPDSRTLAVANEDRDDSEDGEICLWDARTGALREALPGTTALCRAIAFSRDGRALAASTHGVTVYDTGDRRPRTEVTGGQFALSADGATLATVTDKYPYDETWLWDARTGARQAVLRGSAKRVQALAFSPDGRTLAAGGDDTMVRLWDVQSRKTRATLEGHRGSVQTLAFSPDGRLLVSADWWQHVEKGKWAFEPEVRLWDPRTGHLICALPREALPSPPPVFSGDGKTLATAGENNTALLWSVPTGGLKTVLKGHAEYVSALAFSPDGACLATGSGDCTARLWNLRSGELVRVFTGHEKLVDGLAYSPDGGTLATGSDDMEARLWDVRTGQARAKLRGSKGAGLTLAFSPDGTTFATASGGTRHRRPVVRLWDLVSGQCRAALRGHADAVEALTFSPDSRTLATGSDDATVRLWEAQSGRNEATLKGHWGWNGWVLVSSPDGTMRALGSWDKVTLWWVAGDHRTVVLTCGSDEVSALTFSPDGRTLAVLTKGWHVQKDVVSLWDTQTGTRKALIRASEGGIEGLAFSPDGRALAIGAHLWDAQTGQLRVALKEYWPFDRWGLALPKPPVVFSPDGSLVAAGWDVFAHETRVWDAATGALRSSLPDVGDAQRRYVDRVGPALSFLPDGRRLAIQHGDGSVHLWDTSTGKQIALASIADLAALPARFSRPVQSAGAAVTVRDPRDGRVLATMLPILDADSPDPAAHDPDVTARPIEVAAKGALPPASNEWFVTTPEGYFDCSANAARFIKWNVNGALFPAERYQRRFHRPDLVQKSLRGEKLAEPEMTNADIPPSSLFPDLKDGQAIGGDAATVTVEARGVRDIKEVELLVNGRPLSPEQARPTEVAAKPIEVTAKSAGLPYRVRKQFAFRVALPEGSDRIRLRAVAYDEADLGSDPVEVVLQRTGAKPVAGDLYVLSVGVSNYQRADGQGFKNLRFPALDAQAITERFRREGGGLYQKVQTRELTDAQATLAGVRQGLQWLQDSVRPGQEDTVVIYLSGHGFSTAEGRYYFATHEFDPARPAETGLSGEELREALGGRLRAKAVFLFVDACHSGGLRGASDALAHEIGDGVFLLASSGAREYSYESPAWGHGAFTLALLKSLANKDLEDSGAIRFIDLTSSVRRQLAGLMREAGRNEGEQEPCVPLSGRRLGEPVATARP